MKKLTSKILSNALTYIFLRPSEAPTEARPTIKLTKTKIGVKKIVKKTKGDGSELNNAIFIIKIYYLTILKIYQLLKFNV